MNDVVIIKGEGGIGRQEPNTDNIRGLVMNMGATAPTGLAVSTPMLLLSLKDAEDAGIDAAYDTANTVLCWYHIKEIFAENPSCNLWIYLTPQATTLTAMVDGTAGTPCPMKKLALATNLEIKQYGCARNPATGYTPTITAGIDVDVTNAIPKAQVLMDDLFTAHGPAHVIIEGRSFSGSATTAANLRALTGPNVSVVLAQDLDVAPPAADAVIKMHAAVGTLLGTSSKGKVSDNVGWVGKNNVRSLAYGRWINPGLSSNTSITTFTPADLDTLNTKGYIFVRTFVEDSGAYWNDNHNCVTLSSDYAYMSDVLTINKAVRGVYKALLPKVNSPVKVNADGQLSTEVIASYESTATRPLDNMEISEEISAKDLYIDPSQNLISQSQLNVKIAIVPIGTARTIGVVIGFTVAIA